MLLPSPSRRDANVAAKSLASFFEQLGCAGLPSSTARKPSHKPRPKVPAAHAAPLSPVLRAAHPPPLHALPPQVQARRQPAQRVVPPPTPVSAPVPPARPQPIPQRNQQTKAFAIPRRRARVLPDSREASFLPPFNSPAVLPPQSLHKKRACLNARRSAYAPAPKLLVPVAHSIQASKVPSFIDV